MNEAEWQTRKQRIDTRLRALQPPWKIVRHSDGLDVSTLDRVAVEELPATNGPANTFRNVSSFDIGPPQKTSLTLPEVIENIWQNVDRDYHERLLRIDKDMNREVAKSGNDFAEATK